MKPSTQRFWALLVGLGIVMFCAPGPVWAQEYSHARIVRLSFVEGTVTVQRPDVQEWAEAPVNTPLQEGFKLSTGENSFAEVQFENGSAARLGQLSLLEFTQLGLLSNGGKLNHLTLTQGYATFDALVEGIDDYEVSTPNGTLTPQGKAMFRLDLEEGLERVEVFQGSVDVSSPLGTWTLAKNQMLELRPGADPPDTVSQGITKDDWDNWVSEREANATMAPNGPSPRLYSDNVSDLLYGWNDLSAFGMWSYMPGYGYGWSPTASFGWTPYTLGRWCWYPGFGYTWISAEPWGWLPYHYGGWTFLPGTGWAWFPNNFAVWSPALVTWYSGPGWIGWVPARGRPGGLPNHCPLGRPCGAAVSTTGFQNGAAVTPYVAMPVNPLDGRRIDRPDVQPTQSGLLPGPAVSQPTWIIGRQSGAGAPSGIRVTRMVDSEPGGKALGTASSGAASNNSATIQRTIIVPAPRVVAPTSTIVFDPASGRYVNGHTAPVTQSAPSPSPATVEGSAVAGRVTPRAPSQPGAKGVQPGPRDMGQPASPGIRPATPPQPVRPAAAPRDHSGSGEIHHQPAPSQAGPAVPIRNSGGVEGGRSGGEWIRGGGQTSGAGAVRGGGQPGGGENIRGGSAPPPPPPSSPRH